MTLKFDFYIYIKDKILKSKFQIEEGLQTRPFFFLMSRKLK